MSDSLAGKLLVASPGLEDPNFRRTVVLVIRHAADGAFGLVLNRPLDVAPIATHVPRFERVVAAPPVIFGGGPVEPGYAFALGRFPENATLPEPAVFPGVAVIPIQDDAPESAHAVRVFSGYAGWSDGQLDEELRQSAWFVVDPQPSDAFTPDPAGLWQEVLRRQQSMLAMFALYPETPGLN
jgi:putative transcriptional regulator